MAAPERLSDEDARILALESERVAGHTCKVLVLDPPAGGPALDLARLRAHVSARLDAAPRLRQRLAPGPAWVDDPDFDLTRHVRRVPTRGPVDETGLRQIVAERMCERLDRAHPLWSLDLVEDLDGGASALVWKLHHCLADGTASLRLGAAVLWGGAPGADPVPDPASPSPPPQPPVGALRLLAGLPGTLARELRRESGASPLDRPIGAGRAIAFASAPLDDLRRAGHAQPGHVTVNDVVLELVAGGLRAWMERHGARPHELRVQVPVSLHDRDAHPDALANRDSHICVALPLDEPDPVRRLREINAQTAECKRHHDAETLDALTGELGRAPRPLARFATRVAASPHAFALCVSNVPGPVDDRFVAGARIRRMLSLAEIGEHHALRVTALSYAGAVAFGLCADPAAVEDLDALATGIEREAGGLLARV
jgi:diacylglycerol O-acyltransferase / wax synthase